MSSQPGPTASTFWRLATYLRPYVGLMLAATLCALVYAGARTGRALLLQPILDDVAVAQAATDQLPSMDDWLGLLGESAAELTGRSPEPETEAPPGPRDAADAQPDDATATQSDSAIAERVRQAVPRLLLAALLLMTVLPLSHLGQEYLSQFVLGRVLVDIQQELCAKLMALPLGFHHGTARGETLSRVTNDAQRAHASLNLLFADVLQSLIAFLLGVAALLWISWQLTLAIAFAAPLVGSVIAFFGRRIRKSATRRQESQADLTQRLVQILGGIKLIQAFGAQRGEEQAFERENLRYFRRNMKVVKNRALSRSSVEGLTNGIGMLVLMGGLAAATSQVWGMTIGSFVSFFVVMMQATYRPVREITKAWTKLQESIPSAERFLEILDIPPEAEDASDAVEPEGVRDGIRISKVSFSYGREPVLRDISIDVKAGEVVAIVGPTGSGKTTLADLLLRFYDPDAGTIEVDGVDLRQLSRAGWRRQLAVVTQDPFLFSGSIGDNIRYARPDASDAEVTAAAEAAHVSEFIADLPDGYDTDVGDAGVRLSGGQRQRVTIARAILANPAVLIFDEATSSLDAKSERYVQDAIESLLQGRTVFIIAHRLSTVRHADKILVLDGGTVAEQGTHDELIARGGVYRELMAIQHEGLRE